METETKIYTFIVKVETDEYHVVNDWDYRVKSFKDAIRTRVLKTIAEIGNIVSISIEER